MYHEVFEVGISPIRPIKFLVNLAVILRRYLWILMHFLGYGMRKVTKGCLDNSITPVLTIHDNIFEGKNLPMFYKCLFSSFFAAQNTFLHCCEWHMWKVLLTSKVSSFRGMVSGKWLLNIVTIKWKYEYFLEKLQKLSIIYSMFIYIPSRCEFINYIVMEIQLFLPFLLMITADCRHQTIGLTYIFSQ